MVFDLFSYYVMEEGQEIIEEPLNFYSVMEIENFLGIRHIDIFQYDKCIKNQMVVTFPVLDAEQRQKFNNLAKIKSFLETNNEQNVLLFQNIEEVYYEVVNAYNERADI